MHYFNIKVLNFKILVISKSYAPGIKIFLEILFGYTLLFIGMNYN